MHRYKKTFQPHRLFIHIKHLVKLQKRLSVLTGIVFPQTMELGFKDLS